MKRRLLRMLILGVKQFRDPFYQGFAAEISFYLLLSIVPIFLLLTQLLGVFGLSLQNAVAWITQYTGEETSGMLKNLIQFSAAGFNNILFFIVALWAASRAQFSIVQITNYTFTGQQTSPSGANYIRDYVHSYIRQRFRAIVTMSITVFTMGFALLILGFGNTILTFALRLLNINPQNVADGIWMNARWILGLALYFLMVSFNYYILPTIRVPFRKILPGSIFAAAGMLLVTFVYAEYTSNMANYDILYGTLSSVVALMFWFYFLAWVLCLGILVNKVWGDTEEFSKRKPAPRV